MTKCEKCGKEGNLFEIKMRVLSSGEQKVLCKECFNDLKIKIKHSLIGKISLILGLIGFPGIFLFAILADLIRGGISSPEQIYSIFLGAISIPMASGVLAIFLGIIAWGDKDDFGIVAFVLGIISIILGGLMSVTAMFSLMH